MGQSSSDAQLEDALFLCLSQTLNVRPGELRDPSDHTRAFDPNTGRNFVYDRANKAWIDTKTGERMCPKTESAASLEDALFLCLSQTLKVRPGELRVSSDHTRAFDPNTGRNFVYDKKKKAWIDTKTGECICPKCVIEDAKTTPQPPKGKEPSVPKKLENPSTGFRIDIKKPLGLHTIIFTTPKNNRIELYFPDGLYAGLPFSGTIKLFPTGNTADHDELKNYALTVGGQTIVLTNGLLTVTSPTTTVKDTTNCLLVDKKGKEKAGVSLPVHQAASPPANFCLPKSGTAGDLVVIDGPFQGGVVPSDYLRIGGQDMTILAKTADGLVALNTNQTPGPTEIELGTNGSVFKGRFSNLKVDVTADSLNLLKGQSTTVHILVSGLQGIIKPAAMSITASGAISLQGGGSQSMTISPGQVGTNGTFSMDLGLNAIEKGGFGVTVTVNLNEPCSPPR
jgi:hypothetical protein